MTETEMSPRELDKIEATAADLAALGGARISAALGRTLSVQYKTGDPASGQFHDPVSDVDHEVEELIRKEVAVRFPRHDVLGEESEEGFAHGHGVVWAIDPVDGTTNFVNGFPLFACSVGILCRGRPVVGALWCSTSHALRSGVYHARKGGPLRFENSAALRPGRADVQRRLVGLGSPAERELPWDVRKTGSAALECAFVAAGLLEAARFDSPNVWDIAAGIVLAEAAGCAVYESGRDGWTTFLGFPDDDAAEFRHWRRPLVIGMPDTVDHLLSP